MATMPFTPCSSDPCTDVTVSILQTVFGPVIRNLTLGTDPSGVDPVVNVIATMMGYFNSGVLTIATLIVSFVTVVGVINTANDGEAFGRNWSSLWTPVRIVSGAAVLLPTGTGYSFIQLVVMMFSLWAVGFANGTFKIGVENGIIAGSLQNVSQQIGVGSSATVNKDFPLYNMRELASAYMVSAYCAKTVNGVYGDGVVTGLIPPNVALNVDGTPDRSTLESGIKETYIYEFKDRNTAAPLGGGNAICGTVNLYKYLSKAPTPTASTSGDILSAAYSDAARDANNQAISALRDAILASKLTAVKGMIGNIDAWVSSWPTDVNKDWSGVSVTQFNIIVDSAQAAMLTDLKSRMASDNTLKTLMDKFTTDITKDGWAMAGGYYQRLSGIREELRKIYAESPGAVTQPALGWLPDDAKGSLVRQSAIMPAVIARKATDGTSTATGYSATSLTDTSNIASIIPSDWDDVDIDQIGERGNKALNSMVGNFMQAVTDTAIGADGNTDAIARIKATGDILQVASTTLHTAKNVIVKVSGGAKVAAGATSGVPILGGISTVVSALVELVKTIFVEPIMEMLGWLDMLAFYFGVFLPSLPYTIFIVAVIGWFLAVLQTVFAAPLWAVMHMTPDRTFVGSQTQGYLMFLSLFMRPVLIIAALFAAMLLANPIVLYVSKAFWAMRTANVTSAESIGFFVQFLTWKNWLIMYGMLLLPVVYMIYGLTNALPDAILTWIGAGIRPLGETQATSEMRAGSERHGVGAREASAARRLGGGGGYAAGAGGGRLPGAGSGGNSRAGAVPGENRLLSEMGQANISSVPDHVPAGTAKSMGPGQNGSRRPGAAAAAAVGAGAALMASSAVAGQGGQGGGQGGQGQNDALETPSATQAQKGAAGDTAYEPVNTDARAMHNDTPVQEPGHAMHVDKHGHATHEVSARPDEADAILNQSMEPPYRGRGEDDAVAA